jgi:hypothetical protein
MLNATAAGGALIGDLATSGAIGGSHVAIGVRFVTRGVEPGTGNPVRLEDGAFLIRGALERSIKGFAVGAAVSYVTTDLGADGGGVTFDAGITTRRFGLVMGVVGENLGRDFRVYGVRYQLPTRVSLGASLPRRSISTFWDFSASAAITRERSGDIVPRGGVELTYEPVSGWEFTGRFGVRRPLDAAGGFPQSALAIGGSFSLDSFTLDYTFQPGRNGGTAVHSVGFRVQ